MAKMNQAMQDLLRYNAAILPRRRSVFDKSHSHTTTLDSAWLVPLMWDRVLPGDEKQIRFSGLARMATPIHPVMDEANLDVWAFYIPDRLWWTHAKEFYGENKDASFNPDGKYRMPTLTFSNYATRVKTSDPLFVTQGIHSLNDYFGFPTAYAVSTNMGNSQNLLASAGLHRSYQIIWNEWFRNSSIQPALKLNDGDHVSVDEWNEISRLRRVCKYPDMFTTLLREPQAGDDVTLPLGEWAPVVSRAENVDDEKLGDQGVLINVLGDVAALSANHYIGTTLVNGGLPDFSERPLGVIDGSNGQAEAWRNPVQFTNLWANLSNATASTVNNLRAAITIQQLLEIDNLAGKRYQSILNQHFGVFTPDATLQRPELLGATRSRIGMRQVLQTSESTDSSPQGNTAAFSLTNVDNEWICNKSFTEPGFIMVLGAVRPVQSYSQGLNPLITKIDRYDHYWPVFDNLGNQPVPVSEIYCSTNYPYQKAFGGGKTYTTDNHFTKTFGYKEAWQEYRMMPNRVSGLMRPDLYGPDEFGTLASWNYAVAFAGPPVLNSEFVSESPDLIDRTIAVPSEPQFILDCYFDYKDTKNMSVHSVPGLLRL